ncbi:MAG: UDP-3-O-(3-hydroxymyristoyl)glucosamine N-acyltransferase [Phycisphaeraceae bacterium]|nr:MAG: UDP-3-O-(3-hydroxymyristoyl)glucosamine N-acyltransferase [Phycisphaeraceae bacterium]
MNGTMPALPAGLTVADVAHASKGRVVGRGDLALTRLDTLEHADTGTLTFIRSRGYAHMWPGSRASAALVTADIEVPGHDPDRRALIVVDDADLAMLALLGLTQRAESSPPTGVHSSAVVDPGAQVDPTAWVGPLCVVERGAAVGPGARLVSGVRVGKGARVGSGSLLHHGVTVYERCVIGASCVLHAGVVIGADGFGYRPDPAGKGVVKVPHIGNVEVGDHVEIGANACIDRAKFGTTSIGAGTKIDNLVQIAHNCTVGRSCLICGQAALAGSVTLGDGVVIGGQVGIADNVTIGAGARLGAQSGVMADVEPGQTVLGTPARPGREALRNWAAISRIADSLQILREAVARVRRDAGLAPDKPQDTRP